MDKPEVITFKVDGSLKDALQGIQNRSEFIRSAILAALEGACPFCKGTGVLTPHQREHWKNFSRNHILRECETCRGAHVECKIITK